MLKMKTQLYYYDIYPKVLPLHQNVEITIRSLTERTNFRTDYTYEIQIVPINAGVNSNGFPAISITPVTNDGKEISFTCEFASEQEHHIRLCTNGNIIQTLPVYAIDDDLITLMPLIGDFHAHSSFSDGMESPELVGARYRQEGFDFLAITDHRRYAPSIRAIKTYESLDLDFKLYPGEEIHAPNIDVHLVNFGSDSSVNALCLEKNDPASWYETTGKPEWFEEVSTLQKSLQNLPDSIDSFTHASCLLAIKKVHERNGMCILAHPHWNWTVRNVSDEFTKFYLENSFADAFELIGGQTTSENMTQISLYHELRANGIKIPIVGSSDSHSTVNPIFGEQPNQYSMFTEERTLVFAAKNTKSDIISAVKGFYSVAIEQYTGENYRIHGNYRLVQYAIFLYENYFPLHNELCFEEGRLMRMFLEEPLAARNRLEILKGQTVKLQKKYFFNMIGNDTL